ncbi:MAG TPA: class I SAM-dependent methyltransferase [Candidatus Acidoferrum sp.]|nr:class I SAM-dependent methyltransferase [Candidatus Acidoferrum sp.]
MSSWNAMAKLDPLWTILSHPEKKFGKWDAGEFFRTGDREAERVLRMCEAHGAGISSGPVLDFGCGVGRMTRAFSRFFPACVGIDVSEEMVDLARKFNADRPHCEFIASAAPVLPFPDQRFDFVFSVLVLQHLPRKNLILGFIAEFIRVAKNNGVIVFQLTDEVPLRHRMQGRRRLWSLLSSLGIPHSWLFKSFGLAPIRMNGISREKVERFIAGADARVQAVERYDPSEGEFHSYYYIVVKRPVASRHGVA